MATTIISKEKETDIDIKKNKKNKDSTFSFGSDQTETTVNTKLSLESVFKSNIDLYGNYGLLNEKYILIEKIGSGGTSEVFKALNKSNNMYYAAKIIKINSSNDLKLVENELRTLSEVRSPNIVNIIDGGKGSIQFEENTTKKSFLVFYLILEYLDYGDLFSFIFHSASGFGERIGKFVVHEIIKGLIYCHYYNICHRDIKTENIMIGENFSIKISDFGFSAKANNLSGILYTQRGTAAYASPEISENKQYNGVASDIFSLGVTMFVIVTGKMPFKRAIKGDPHYELLKNSNYDFYWKVMEKIIPFSLSDEFKSLFTFMISYDWVLRPSLEEIVSSKWFEELNKDELTIKNEYIIEMTNKMKNINSSKFNNFNLDKNLNSNLVEKIDDINMNNTHHYRSFGNNLNTSKIVKVKIKDCNNFFNNNFFVDLASKNEKNNVKENTKNDVKNNDIDEFIVIPTNLYEEINKIQSFLCLNSNLDLLESSDKQVNFNISKHKLSIDKLDKQNSNFEIRTSSNLSIINLIIQTLLLRKLSLYYTEKDLKKEYFKITTNSNSLMISYNPESTFSEEEIIVEERKINKSLNNLKIDYDELRSWNSFKQNAESIKSLVNLNFDNISTYQSNDKIYDSSSLEFYNENNDDYYSLTKVQILNPLIIEIRIKDISNITKSNDIVETTDDVDINTKNENKFKVEFLKVDGTLFDFLNECSKIRKMFVKFNLES